MRRYATGSIVLLSLSLLLLVVHLSSAQSLRSESSSSNVAANDSSSSPSSSIIKKFLTYPFQNHDDDESNIASSSSSAFPLFSTRERYNNDEDGNKHILFSFTLPSTNSVVRRHNERKKRRATRALQEGSVSEEGMVSVGPLSISTQGEIGDMLSSLNMSSAFTTVEDTTVEDTAAEQQQPTPFDDNNNEDGWTWCTRDDGTKYICSIELDPFVVTVATNTAHDGGVHGTTTHGEDGEEMHSDAHSMVVHVTYQDIYAILVFLIAATAMGIFTSKLGMPALVGEMFAGFLLGPPLADFVPYPEALVLVGEIGLIMLLLEAGVELDVAQLRETGTRALAIGLTGTILPLLVGMGLGYASGQASNMKSALAVGASFSPTSLGVAASALKSGKMLDTPVGQLIVASCVVDDVLALILLSMFKVLVKDSPPIYEYFIPIISSVGFLIVLGGSAVTWMPRMIENKILNKCSESYRELVMFSIMVVMLLAYLPLLNYTQASYLTGAFLAGVTFSQINGFHHAFMEQTHQLMTWLLRVFFAASIGFQVPVKLFGDPFVVGWGFILYACVAAKLPLAFYVPQFEDVKEGASYNPFLRDRIITALAMTCRGEFSFIIAAFALSEGLFTAQMYAAIVWAVLLSCVTSPFMLLNTIKLFNKKQLDYLASTNPLKLAKDGGDIESPLFLHVKAKAKAFGGMQEEFRKILNELGLEVVERRTNRDGRGLDATVQTDMFVRDTTMNVKLQKIAAQKRIKRNLAKAIETSGTSASGLASFRAGSVRMSSSNLSSVSLQSLGIEEQDAIQQAAQEEDKIIKRSDLVEKRIEEALGEGADVIVDVWSPWPWTEVLDKIREHYGITDDPSDDNVETFVAVFDKIDTDGGGSLDQEEMYDALIGAGLDITEEGVLTLFTMIDEDGNGDIDRDEWRETVEFYLELKKEEAEMHTQSEEQVDFMKELRAKKLAQLGKTQNAKHDFANRFEGGRNQVAVMAVLNESKDEEDGSLGMDIDGNSK